MWNKKIPNYQLIQVLLDRTTTDDCESHLSLIYIFFFNKADANAFVLFFTCCMYDLYIGTLPCSKAMAGAAV